jgi:CRP/FNR family transcriptional regulator, cyclic AMP receptor protein
MTSTDPAKPAGVDAKPVALEELEIFKGVAPATVEQIAGRAQRRAVAKGELLFNVGDAADSFYVVLDGRMKIWTVSATGVEVTLNVLTAGTEFGEIGMLDGSVRTAGASAMAPTQLLSISRRSFFDAMDRDPKLARNVIELLCKRLRWTSARMEDATLRQAPERLARILCHLARDHGRKTPRGTEITIKLTQGELAQWTAMSREGLNKLLKRWIDDGIMIQEKGVLTIRKLDELDEIGEYGEAE